MKPVINRARVGDKVIFKQRQARHLAVHEKLAWEYEVGDIISASDASDTERDTLADDTVFDVCWLQGYHSRNDDVPRADVVAIINTAGGSAIYGSFTIRGFLIHMPQEEGT